MMNADYYVLLKTDGLADVWQTVHEEISCAEEMGVPIVVVEYRWAGKPQVAMKNEAFAQHVSQGGVASVLAGVLEGLRNYQNTPAIAPLGWLRSDTYAALDAAATEINRINRAFLEAQPLIRDFVGCCNVTSLLETFTSEGILLPKQRFGTCVKFASKEMPISRFSHADGNGVGNVEILFNLIPNRFEQLENPDVVFDTYLNLYWMRRPPKHLSYSAAIEAVSKCNACGLNWRLPKAAEIITLLTHEYGGRKFMDEEVFPIGRWYWLGDPPVRNGDQECAYYADFNYQAGLIDVEPLPTDGAMVKMRLKSALFVSEKVDPVMSI